MTVTIIATPGHTPGTLSMIFPARITASHTKQAVSRRPISHFLGQNPAVRRERHQAQARRKVGVANYDVQRAKRRSSSGWGEMTREPAVEKTSLPPSGPLDREHRKSPVTP
jgi:hypothetical protein